MFETFQRHDRVANRHTYPPMKYIESIKLEMLAITKMKPITGGAIEYADIEQLRQKKKVKHYRKQKHC